MAQDQPPLPQPQPALGRPFRAERSASSSSLTYPHNAAIRRLNGRGSQLRSSQTWTTSSGDLGLLSNTDEVDDRSLFVQEYNRLAKKHRVRILVLDDFVHQQSADALRASEKRGWFFRMIMLRSTSSQSPTALPKLAIGALPRHKRSVSDLAHNLVHSRREPPKTIELQDLVRLSGKSLFYLPQEYSPCSLILPTCLRATAQHLAQNVTTRGIFRIPGSVKIVNALFHYYCHEESGGAHVASTVRCVNLPGHIQASVHDVASTFKRILSVLPGGILGSKALFDALIAIHSRLHGDPEFPRTKQTKVRARLIALAIGTIRSQFRREIICAVFGLLSLIGRVAEVTPREDDEGRPLPTGDLMGYNALGIIFGPLLIGDLLEQYEMNVASPTSGLLLLPRSPPKLRRIRRKSKGTDCSPHQQPAVDKILVANNLAQMLIANWRDVIRQMKALGTHHSKVDSAIHLTTDSLRPSISESFIIKKPQDWERTRAITGEHTNHEGSPEPDTPTLGIRRQRPRSRKSGSSAKMKKPSFNALSPTAEESITNDNPVAAHECPQDTTSVDRTRYSFASDSHPFVPKDSHESSRSIHTQGSVIIVPEPSQVEDTLVGEPSASGVKSPPLRSDIPPRTSSKRSKKEDASETIYASESLSDNEMIEVLSAKERSSMESSGLRRSRWPNKRNLHHTSENAAPTPDRARTETPRSSTTPSKPLGDPDLYQLSVGSVRKSAQRPENCPPILGSLSDSDSSAEVSSLMEALKSVSHQENVDFTRNRRAKSPPTTEILRFSDSGTFYRQKVSQPPDVFETGSMDSTPQHFYSPMRVPPSLSNQRVDIEAPRSEPRPSQSSLQRNVKGQQKSPSSRSWEDSFGQRVRDKSSPTWRPTDETQNRADHQLPEPTAFSKPVRPSVSEAARSRAGVKAMAAMWENQDTSQGGSPQKKPGSRTQSIASRFSQGSPTKSMQSSRSGPSIAPPLSKRSSWSYQTQPTSRRPTQPDLPSTITTGDSAAMKQLRTSVSDSVALRAAAIMDAQKSPLAGISPLKPVSNDRPLAKKTSESDFMIEKTLKSPPSLGTMVPFPELPPVALHLNLPRPSSSSPMPPQSDEMTVQAKYSGANPIPRPTSTTLHAQIRKLQRQLDAKTEETVQLRRQIEAQENSDVGTLSEQLREAKRELMMWKERAEAAERRVKVFEKFTAKLRGIREAAAAADRQGVDKTHSGNDWLNRRSGREDDGNNTEQHTRYLKVRGKRRVTGRSTGEMSDDSGRTEDAGVVTARIRKCLHGEGGNNDGPSDIRSFSFDGPPEDGKVSPKAGTRDISQSAAEIWIAAQELLHLDEEC